MSHRCRSRQIFGCAKDFGRIFPNLPEKKLQNSDLQNKNSSFHFERQFFQITACWASFFPYLQEFCSYFQRVREGFQRFCPHFTELCRECNQIKTFGDALSPPPPTPVTCPMWHAISSKMAS